MVQFSLVIKRIITKYMIILYFFNNVAQKVNNGNTLIMEGVYFCEYMVTSRVSHFDFLEEK
jgi:hypothetical protein